MESTNDAAHSRSEGERVAGHLRRMRMTAIVVLLIIPVALAAGFAVPHRASSVASPLAITVVAVIASLWVGFSANRDAATRLDRIKRSFAVHGDEDRLLRDHWLVYIVVLARLLAMVACGLLVAVWGLGPIIAVVVFVLAGVLTTLTWPTDRKARLLLARGRALRDPPSRG